MVSIPPIKNGDDWGMVVYGIALPTLSGWWYTYPSEKYEFVSWDYYSQYMENKKCLKPPASYNCVYGGKCTTVVNNGMYTLPRATRGTVQVFFRHMMEMLWLYLIQLLTGGIPTPVGMIIPFPIEWKVIKHVPNHQEVDYSWWLVDVGG